MWAEILTASENYDAQPFQALIDKLNEALNALKRSLAEINHGGNRGAEGRTENIFAVPRCL